MAHGAPQVMMEAARTRRISNPITRTRRPLAGKRASRETVYAITDLTYDDITATQLADAIRGHGSIKNRQHWVRDVSFAEDLSQIRTGHGPQTMATLRNFAVSLHRAYMGLPTSPPVAESAETQTASCQWSEKRTHKQCRGPVTPGPHVDRRKSTRAAVAVVPTARADSFLRVLADSLVLAETPEGLPGGNPA